MSEPINQLRYQLTVKPYGIRIERMGLGVDLTPYSLMNNGQNSINDAARLIETRIENGAAPDEQARIVQKAHEAGDFVTGDDGFQTYWPDGLHGAMSAWHLRCLADELDTRNAVWAAQLEREMSKPKAAWDGETY